MSTPTATQLLASIAPGTAAATALTLASAAIATRLVRLILLFLIRRAAHRRLSGESTRWKWRTRLPRRPEESNAAVAEIRRRHRIDATALALARLSTVVIWLSASVVLLHVHGISVTVAVGSAGFVGLILALGAQASVSDYVTGLHVLLEDRFGEGDEIELTTPNGRQLRGVVTAHGMFGTRLQSEGETHHIANRLLSEVTNHSQLGVVTTVELEHTAEAETLARAAVRRAQRARPSMPDLVVDQIEHIEESGRPRSRIHVRSSHALGDTDRHHFGEQLRRLVAKDEEE